MTTIINFIQGNFIANPQQKEVQKPFWVLDSPNLQINHKELVQSFLSKCKIDKKPLIHIDLGLSSFVKYPSLQIEVKSESGIAYLKQSNDLPYYLVKSGTKDRKKDGFLTNLITRIHRDIQQQGKLRQDKAKCSHTNYEFGLLVQGIQAWSLLNQKQPFYQKDIEGFIAALVSSPIKIRQVTIITWSSLLSSEVNFYLQRSSTCLTKILSKKGNQWKCFSTVRRYSGFSNEEQYSLQTLENGRVKVVKKKKEKGEQRSKDQIQMVNSLGFTVEKDQSSIEQQKQLKELIFPHLKMRQMNQQNKCLPNTCKANCNCEQKMEDLIVLDDQQEDEDDIDV